MKLASRGQRDMDGGVEAITDPTERHRVNRQALRVWAKTLVFAAVLTLAVWLAPV